MSLRSIIAILISILSLGANGSVSDVSKQYSNRNWNYPAIEVAIKYRHLDYSDLSLVSTAVSSISKLESDFNLESFEDLTVFYPTAELLDSSNLSEFLAQLNSLKQSYLTYLKWDIIFDAISEERWEDADPVDCKESQAIPIDNQNCGRKSKGNYAFSNLSSSQRATINELKDAVIAEIDFYKNAKNDIIIGPGPAMIFQFLYDSRAIDKLIQPSFVQKNDPLNLDLRKRNIIEIGRALVIQMFQDKNGKITNSDLKEIILEKNICFSLPLNQRMDCQLNYLRALIWDPQMQVGNQVITNLILDPKGIRPLFDSLVLNFSRENSEEISREQLLEFLERVYVTLCIAYDSNPMNPQYSDEFINKFITQTKQSIEYLINKRNIIGLKIARGLQELILFLETNT